MPQTEPIQNILQFGGLVTNTTPDKIPDRNASDVSNMDFSLNGMIQTIRGYELFGNEITDPGVCVDSFLYKKNYGTVQRVKLRTRDDGSEVFLEWFNTEYQVESPDGQWELLLDGLTTGTKMGFAQANGDGGIKINKLIMGNAVDPMIVWEGSLGVVESFTANTITIEEDILAEGFATAGHVISGGVDYTYTNISGASTFTGVTPDPTANGLEATRGVAQKVDIDLLEEHIIVANTIAFVNSTPATITDSGSGFVTAGFTVGQKIAVAGSTANAGVYEIATVVAGTLTLKTGQFLTAESAGPKITIAAGAPLGNILLTAQRKLFISGNPDNPSKVYYSQSGEVTSFGITSGLGSGGSFDLIEGGGNVTLLEAKGKNTVVCHKKDTIIAYTRDNDGTNAIESFDILTDGFDNGATNFKAKTALNKTSFFMTGIEGAKLLEQAVESNILAMNSITDIILPTLETYDNSNAVAAYFAPKRVLLIATDDSSGNRKLISIYVKGSSGNFLFDISIDDIPVADFIVDGKDLYFVSSLDQNAYKMFGRNSANGGFLNHRYVTKEYTFDKPANDKQFDVLYIEGVISQLTKIRITVQYGIFGSESQKSYTIESGDVSIVSDTPVSSLGIGVLGETSLGGNNQEIMNGYIFSLPIHFDVNDATRFKVVLETYYDDPDDYDVESYWAVFNLSTDARLMDISKINMQNSNEVSSSGVGAENVGYQIS